MRHLLRLWWLGVLCALATLALAGCISDVDCNGSPTTWSVPGGTVEVEPWHTRVEHRIVLTMSAEAAASHGGDAFRTASHLRFVAGRSRGDVVVLRVGLSRVDGSDITYDSYRDGTAFRISLEDALGDCGAGQCRREFLFWADVIREGVVGVGGSLSIPVATCEESRDWFDSEVEHLGNTPEAPPDAGVAP